MSNKSCQVCGLLIKEGERVEVLVRATFHALKSKVAYALDRDDLEPVGGTMVHIDCADSPESYPED